MLKLRNWISLPRDFTQTVTVRTVHNRFAQGLFSSGTGYILEQFAVEG